MQFKRSTHLTKTYDIRLLVLNNSSPDIFGICESFYGRIIRIASYQLTVLLLAEKTVPKHKTNAVGD